MKKLIQTRLHNPPQKGNCYPTVIACFMDLESSEDVIQIQEYYPKENEDTEWFLKLWDWLEDRGWGIKHIDGHLYDNSFYCVTGNSLRGNSHICIYQNGKLFHDPHPDSIGLITEKHFEIIYQLSTISLPLK
jgi:hypothetical protein